jgi:hypothetical protein
MLAGESPGLVCHETVSEWSQKLTPHPPMKRRREMWGFCRIPACVYLVVGRRTACSRSRA